jgi:hypothetical protein
MQSWESRFSRKAILCSTRLPARYLQLATAKKPSMEVLTRGQIVGALACQKNSYLRSLEAEVVSCTKRPAQPVQNGPKKKAQGASQAPADSWLIEFSDSVLFPEGE